MHLNLISFDIPWPVDYGGVFDVFYKIVALKEAGVQIHLHCFEYGRSRPKELEGLCAEIHYYPRLTGVRGLSTSIPYIVKSRAHPQLLENLQKNDYPILMEGMHCSYFLHSGQLDPKRCFVRLPNVEHAYYQKLANASRELPKKVYYYFESRLLKKYERSLANIGTYWTLSTSDLTVFNETLGYQNIDNLPLYLPNYIPEWKGEKGAYCLYQGNLSVEENEFAAIWLLENIFSTLEIPFVIAGKNPSKKLAQLAHTFQHTCLVANPTDKELGELIKKSQVNILPSFNATGVKLKVINALYQGRHCLVNRSAVEGSGVETCCEIANTAHSMKEKIIELFDKPFTYYNFEARVATLQRTYNNQLNAEQMIGWIFKGEPSIPGANFIKRQQL